MNVIEADSGRDAMLQASDLIFIVGQKVSPRGFETLELSPATVVIHDPTDTLPCGINRKGLAPAVGIAEALQGIAGVSTPDLLQRIAPSFGKFLNKDQQFDGAYGPRLADQLPMIETRLRQDPDTRQAIAAIWQPHDTARHESKDYPCTLNLHFLIRDGMLNLHVYMRSNDLWLGAPYDWFQFSQIQCTMAHVLGVKIGSYYHTASSLHVYSQHYDKLRELDDDPNDPDPYFWAVNGLQASSWYDARIKAKYLLRGLEYFGMCATATKFHQELAPFTNADDIFHFDIYKEEGR